MIREWLRRHRAFWAQVLVWGIRAEVWHILFILTAMPLQVLLSYNLSKRLDPNMPIEERFAGRVFSDHFTTLLSLEIWRRLYLQRIKLGLVDVSPRQLYPDSYDPRGECPAAEVLKHRFPQGHYGMSHIPRLNRNRVNFRIGNIVQHLVHGYRGVIVGWDLRARAPTEWFKAQYDADKVLAAHIRTEPHFALLVDVRDRTPPQMVYVPQHLLIRHDIYLTLNRGEKAQIIHPVMFDYFVDFNGLNYTPRPWLRALYPRD